MCMKTFKMIVALVLIALLSGCAAQPKVVQVVQARDAQLQCTQLAREIQQTERYKILARQEDRFRLRYMFPITGFWSIYNINKAEKNAIARLDRLQELAIQRGCYPASRTNSKQYVPGAASLLPQGSIPSRPSKGDPSGGRPMYPGNK